MVIKDNFVLLKNVSNIMDLSESEIAKLRVPNGFKLFESVMWMIEPALSHMNKADVFKFLDKKKEHIEIVSMSDYPLYIAYNKRNDKILINLFSFGVDTITPTRPDPKNLYAALLYGICFRNVVTGKYDIKTSYFDTIVSFILSMVVQMFGREYGLIGKFSNEIPKLKFLISCYILTAFFGISRPEIYKSSMIVSGFNPKDYIDKLDEYDFNSIEDFIKSTSELGAMPGMTKFTFTAKCYRYLGINFLPALEDSSRFIASFAASSVAGNTIIPGFIYKYNKDAYLKILAIVSIILKKS